MQIVFEAQKAKVLLNALLDSFYKSKKTELLNYDDWIENLKT